MNSITKLVILILALSMVLTGCGISADDPTVATRGSFATIGTEPTTEEPMEPSTEEPSIEEPSIEEPSTEPTTLPTLPPEPVHSDLYIPGLEVDDVIRFFNEVCLDAEFSDNGNPSLIQKWVEPIYYQINGDYTEQDMIVLNSFTEWLNTIHGFPGIAVSPAPYQTNMEIYFCNVDEMIQRMGEQYAYMDGAVTFWYMDNAIYNEIICYRSEINQFTRNSVILEEIYNGLGPVQDTSLREDSLIYSGFSEPQWMTDVDELILKLLYHPLIEPGMNADECETIIRELYY